LRGAEQRRVLVTFAGARVRAAFGGHEVHRCKWAFGPMVES
jgi:hypothetical protein